MKKREERRENEEPANAIYIHTLKYTRPSIVIGYENDNRTNETEIKKNEMKKQHSTCKTILYSTKINRINN